MRLLEQTSLSFQECAIGEEAQRLEYSTGMD